MKIVEQSTTSIRIVLDRSGSMQNSQETTLEALNTYLEELKNQKVSALLTLSTFDSISIDIPISKVNINELKSIPNSVLNPRAATPLYDAIGLAVHDLEKVTESTDKNKVLVIVTDGLENASREYTYQNISSLIQDREKAGWLIIYLGADHDAMKQSSSLNFDKKRSMKYSKLDSIDTFKTVSKKTFEYTKGIKNLEIEFTNRERFLSDKLGFIEEE
jgi:hypothetical protein